jgi:hypothetical protein
MAFLDDAEDNVKVDSQEEVDKIKVGDLEFESSELEEIVGKYKEIEKNHGSLDKVVSTLGERANKIGQLESQVETLAKQLESTKGPEKQPDDKPTPEDILREAEGRGIITKNNLTQAIQEYRQAERLADEARDLEKKGNPYEADELPKFNALDMLQFMSETGIKNPVTAYKQRYETEIDSWKEKQLSKGRPKGMVTEESSSPGNKQPKEIKVTRDNIDEMLRASLNREI